MTFIYTIMQPIYLNSVSEQFPYVHKGKKKWVAFLSPGNL